MPTYKLLHEVEKGVEIFNNRANNKALSFKVYSLDSYCLYVQGSFDFAYYVNVHIECRNILFTNLKENTSWPDAWHEDQLFLMNEEEYKKIHTTQNLSIPDESYFGLIFNLANRENSLQLGAAICNELHIWWECPKYHD